MDIFAFETIRKVECSTDLPIDNCLFVKLSSLCFRLRSFFLYFEYKIFPLIMLLMSFRPSLLR